MKTSEPKPEEILKKYTFGDPAKLWADDAEKAMQEYAESYHKEKMREELILYDEYLDEHVENEKSKVCKIKRFSDYLKQKQ